MDACDLVLFLIHELPLNSFLWPSRLSFPISLLSASQRLTIMDPLFSSIGLTTSKREKWCSGYLFSQVCGFSLAWLHRLSKGHVSSPGGHLHMTLFKNFYNCSVHSPLQGCKQSWCWPGHIFVNSSFIKLPWVILIWMCHLFLAGTQTKIYMTRSQKLVTLSTFWQLNSFVWLIQKLIVKGYFYFMSQPVQQVSASLPGLFFQLDSIFMFSLFWFL